MGVIVRLVVFLVMLPATLFIAAAPQRATAQDTNVLFLIATHPHVPAFLVTDSAMREALAKKTKGRFQFFTETLDAQRFAFAEFEQEFLALLAKKYKGLQIDVIVTVTRPALVFANRHRNALWPNARVIFHSISPRVRNRG